MFAPGVSSTGVLLKQPLDGTRTGRWKCPGPGKPTPGGCKLSRSQAMWDLVTGGRKKGSRLESRQDTPAWCGSSTAFMVIRTRLVDD